MSQTHSPRGLVTTLRDRRVALGLWLVFLPSLGFGTLTVLGSLRLDEFGASAVAIGAIWVVASALEATLSPIAGRLADRCGVLWLTRYGLAVATVVTLIVPLASVAWLLAVLIVLSSPSYGSLWVPGMALMSEGAEAAGADQSYAFAIFNMGWGGAQIAGSAGGASLAQATADAVPFLIVAGLALATLLALQTRRATELTLGSP